MIDDIVGDGYLAIFVDFPLVLACSTAQQVGRTPAKYTPLMCMAVARTTTRPGFGNDRVRSDDEIKTVTRLLLAGMSKESVMARNNSGGNALHLAGGCGHDVFLKCALQFVQRTWGSEAACYLR